MQLGSRRGSSGRGSCADAAGDGRGPGRRGAQAPVRTLRPSGPYFHFDVRDGRGDRKHQHRGGGEAPGRRDRPSPRPRRSRFRSPHHLELEIWSSEAPTRQAGSACCEGPSALHGTRRRREGASPSPAAPPRRLRRRYPTSSSLSHIVILELILSRGALAPPDLHSPSSPAALRAVGAQPTLRGGSEDAFDPCLAELLPQRRSDPVEPRLDGAQGTLEHVGNLLERRARGTPSG